MRKLKPITLLVLGVALWLVWRLVRKPAVSADTATPGTIKDGKLSLPAELVAKIKAGTATKEDIWALPTDIAIVVACEIWLYGMSWGDNNKWTDLANAALSYKLRPGWNNVPAGTGNTVDGLENKKAWVKWRFDQTLGGKRPGIWPHIDGVD